MNAANALTLFRIALTPFFVVFLFKEGVWPLYAATLFFLVASLSDYYDGYLARKRGSVTRLGRFLDPLADKVLTSAAFISFALLKIVVAWLVYTMIVREIVITALRVYAIFRKNPLITSRLAKWKTSTQMSVVFITLVFLSFNKTQSPESELTLTANDWMYWVINGMVFFVTALAVTTGIHYLFQNLIFSRKSAEELSE
jgi:CDP-diacylglycerol--glycerol-3-phosphate 3-phosphatidyltransferase